MSSNPPFYVSAQQPRIYYGWYIVAVGFLAHTVCAFHLSSTLSVFLKPLTEELGVSRGLFSLLRSGEIVIVFAHISDIGYPSMIAATVMSIIAFTQLGSTLFWGFLSERVEIRKATTLMFLIQATGVGIAVATTTLTSIYMGFFVYGVGLGGSLVLQEVIWATYYGTRSLGTVRGLGMLITLTFGAAGAPFFGFLFDATGSYAMSFILFALALLLCAILSLAARPPQKQKWVHA